MSEQSISLEKSGNNKTEHAVIFHGQGGEYFKIWFVNFLLTVITLGIYSAWATVRERKYFYGNTEINGDRFDYHATPQQLLLGRIVVIVGIVLFYALIFMAPRVAILMVLAFLLSIPWLTQRSWRFNAIMSSFRGIRFNYHCDFGRAYWVMIFCPALLFIGLYIFIVVTALLAGFLGPIAIVLMIAGLVVGLIFIQATLASMRAGLYINNSLYGQNRFKVMADKKAFMKIYAISLVILLPFILLAGFLASALIAAASTVVSSGSNPQVVLAGLTSAFGSIIMAYLVLIVGALVAGCYQVVAQRNLIFSQTTFVDSNISLKSTMRTSSYLGLMFINTLMIIFSWGLAIPLVHIRTARYFAESTQVIGDLSLLNVQAHHDTAKSAVAEEISQAFDINLNI